MIRSIPFLCTPADIVLSHQERFDGQGYPRSLRGAGDPHRRAHLRRGRHAGRDDRATGRTARAPRSRTRSHEIKRCARHAVRPRGGAGVPGHRGEEPPADQGRHGRRQGPRVRSRSSRTRAMPRRRWTAPWTTRTSPRASPRGSGGGRRSGQDRAARRAARARRRHRLQPGFVRAEVQHRAGHPPACPGGTGSAATQLLAHWGGICARSSVRMVSGAMELDPDAARAELERELPEPGARCPPSQRRRPRRRPVLGRRAGTPRTKCDVPPRNVRAGVAALHAVGIRRPMSRTRSGPTHFAGKYAVSSPLFLGSVLTPDGDIPATMIMPSIL